MGFRAHQTLASKAGDLLSKFTVSTKVGYFPASGAPAHSLDPDRLRAAVEEAVQDLGREPDLVFLHNPEHSLVRVPETSAPDSLVDACSVLVDATARGLCGSWGISSWDPRTLAGLSGGGLPRPDVLMVRAGLLVGIETLEAAELISRRWQPSAVWGMSPFGGSTSEPLWERFDPRVFIRDAQHCTPAQAAFRTAFALPAVDKVAVSTSSIDHLRELVGSLDYQVDQQTVDHYRRLLHDGRQTD
ncbi:aldo/keto reductase [Streptomyces sp. NPDC002133]|uniref:aldo/keto reductase n=1 Tax=Streptomyces sp. NPDC002133 TaxID=3154409 RepID=UPI00331AAB5D